MQKQCKKCKGIKLLDEFSAYKRSPDKKQSYCKDCNSRIVSEWSRNNPIRSKAITRKHLLKKKYGVTEAAFTKLLRIQDNRCGICQTEFSLLVRQPDVDHCHETLKVRGLLCYKCNTALGLFKDSIVNLERAAQYLKQNGT